MLPKSVSDKIAGNLVDFIFSFTTPNSYYRYGGESTIQGFDCSGILWYALQRVGINLGPRFSSNGLLTMCQDQHQPDPRWGEALSKLLAFDFALNGLGDAIHVAQILTWIPSGSANGMMMVFESDTEHKSHGGVLPSHFALYYSEVTGNLGTGAVDSVINIADDLGTDGVISAFADVQILVNRLENVRRKWLDMSYTGAAFSEADRFGPTIVGLSSDAQIDATSEMVSFGIIANMISTMCDLVLTKIMSALYVDSSHLLHANLNYRLNEQRYGWKLWEEMLLDPTHIDVSFDHPILTADIKALIIKSLGGEFFSGPQVRYRETYGTRRYLPFIGEIAPWAHLRSNLQYAHTRSVIF